MKAEEKNFRLSLCCAGLVMVLGCSCSGITVWASTVQCNRAASG